ncbi:hypothetical protein [Sinomonas sp. P10A9]|uniref:HTH araC/xylS-type domain-containing protein n=1 Tax=Sinomonas puerhi TaxID=3238584 RepID=A0AB39L442_9MICC
MCHPAWGPVHAPVPYPCDLARVRRVRDLIDRNAARSGGNCACHLDTAALARAAGVPAAQLAGEFALAYGMSPEEYAALRRDEPVCRPVRNREAALSAPRIA